MMDKEVDLDSPLVAYGLLSHTILFLVVPTLEDLSTLRLLCQWKVDPKSESDYLHSDRSLKVV